MPKVDSDGVKIAYEVVGDGRPVVLVHGFASSRIDNWKTPGWYDTLVHGGRRVIALDCRGHGDSDKPHDAASYSVAIMARDVLKVMDEVGVERAELMGYSMGGRISSALLSHYGERFSAAVLGGIGGGMVGERRGSETIAAALESDDDAAAVSNPEARAFRAFAEQRRNDLKALAACMRGLRISIGAEELAQIKTPVLIAAGDKDNIIGDPKRLVALISGAELLSIPDRDHLTAVGARAFKEGAMRFLNEHA